MLILSQSGIYSNDVRNTQISLKSAIKYLKSSNSLSAKADLLRRAPANLKRSVELALEKEASSLLTVLPWQEHGFSVHIMAFYDTVALRYGWNPARFPQFCSCGALFSIEHSFSCLKGGFPTIRLNEIHDLTANLLTEVCHEIQVEPGLQPISGEQLQHATSNIEDGGCLDISMNGFWGGKCEKTF